MSLIVALELPTGSSVIGISSHGASYWTRTAQIRTLDHEKNEVSYFLKVSHYDTRSPTTWPDLSRRYLRVMLERV
jgi:hypothetical protein